MVSSPSHVDWPVEIKHEFVGYVHHLSPTNAVGVSFTSLHMEDMEETTEFAPAGTGNFFTFGDVAIGLSFARKMTDKFSLRSGYKLNVDEESFTLGAGLSLPLSIAHANLDYAYTDFGRLGNANRFSFVLSF